MSLIHDFPFAMPKSGIEPKIFLDAMARMPTPVSVITTLASDGRPVGATLSAVSSLSLDPPLFLACFDHRSETLRAVRARRRYMVHILAADQAGLAKTFASKSADKFEGLDWRMDDDGLPRVDGCVMALACRLFSVLPGGDHAILAGEVERIAYSNDIAPMVYAGRRMTRPEGETV